jgi:hypothetical protein
MSKYGQSAIDAVTFYQQAQAHTPREAWEHAVSHTFATEKASREKGCPRDAFLGLCEEGLVAGIPAGNYTRSVKNKRYALQAVKYLRRNPSLANDPGRLWDLVMEGEPKTPNQQMEVVTALWQKGLIK